jgi:hypothetical protein
LQLLRSVLIEGLRDCAFLLVVALCLGYFFLLGGLSDYCHVGVIIPSVCVATLLSLTEAP